MEGQTVVTVLSLLGVGAVVSQFVGAVIGWLTGRNGREDSAWEQRDAEARARRKLEEYASTLRHLLHEKGMDYEDMPPWPTYDTRRGAGSGQASASK